MRHPAPPELCLLYPRDSLTAANGDGLSNIIVDEVPDGALCVVPGQGVYLLDKFSTDAVASPTVIATARGAAAPGRWVQISTGVPLSPPLSNRIWVDPTSTVAPETGSILAPFTVMQDAVDATTLGTQWTIIVPSGIPVPMPGDLQIPPGASIEIMALGLDQGGILTGNIDWNANDGFLGLTNLFMDGNVGGIAAGPESTFIAQNTTIDGQIGFTGSPVHCYISGPFPQALSSGFSFTSIGPGGNAIDINGNLFASGVRILGDIQCLNAFFENSRTESEQILLDGTVLQFKDSSFAGLVNVTFVGAAGVVTLDVYSDQAWNTSGPNLNNGTVAYTAPSNGEFIVNFEDAAAYPTIQEAINAAATTALNRGAIINVAPGTYAETITIPDGNWQIRGMGDRQSLTTHLGTITWSPLDGSSLTLENFHRSSSLVGTLAAGTAHLNLNSMTLDSATVLSGAGTIHVSGANPYGGLVGNTAIAGQITCTGRLSLNNYLINGNLTATGDYVYLNGCSFAGSPTAISTAATEIDLIGCNVGGPGASVVVAFTFSGGAGVVYADGYTMSQLLAESATVTNGTLQVRSGGIPVALLNQVNNIAATDIIANPVTGLYRFDVALIVKVVGTAGTIQPNVIFTDALGSVTVPVGTGLNIVGTGRVQGSYILRAVGPNNIQFSVTGVVTPGTLNYDIEVCATKL